MYQNFGLLLKISLFLLVLQAPVILACSAEHTINVPGVTTNQTDNLSSFQRIDSISFLPPAVNISDIKSSITAPKVNRPSLSSHSFADIDLATKGNVILVPVTPTPEGSGYTYFNRTGSDESYFIYSPGTYSLQEGFSTSNTTAIYLGADDVTLDGNAQTITGNTANFGIIIESNRNNTTVRNFKGINNFCYGIDSSGDQVSLINNSLSENSYTGINSIGSHMYVYKNIIRNNYNGAFLSGNNAVLKDNIISDNEVYGIFGFSKNYTLEKNCFDADEYGVILFGDNLSFHENTVRNNRKIGVQIQSTGASCIGNTISHNSANFHISGNNTTIKSNTISSAFFVLGYGIQAEGVNATISENATYNNPYGIIGSCDDCKTIDNRVYSSYVVGISSEGKNSLISNNIIRDTVFTGLACVGDNTNAYANTIINATYGIAIMDYRNTSVIGNKINDTRQCGLFFSGDYYHPGQGIGDIYNNYFGSENYVGGFNSINQYSYRWTNPSGPERGTNIVGGPFIAGNYWSNPNGTGWSDKQTPHVTGYSTTPFEISPGVNDTAPLVPQKPVTINATANEWGNIVPTGNSSYQSYTNQTFITQSKPGADLTDVVVDSASKGNIPSWTFTDLTENHDIETIGNPAPGQVHVFFTASQRSGEKPLTVAFSSEQSFGSPTSWYWQFGDGCTNTTQNPIHTYESPGTYTVSLRASNGKTGGYSAWNNYITVTDG